MTANSDITLEVSGDVAEIALNRPSKLNAMTVEMTAALHSYAARINEDAGIRVVVMTGSGRSFCVGSDIQDLDRFRTPWELENRPDYCRAVRLIRKPVIAAINGYAFGGGLEMAMACDIRIASETASFGAPEIKLGWIGGGGQSALLAQSVGPSNAALMLMTGDPVDATTALTWGLVSTLTPPDELRSSALVIARTIASRAPIAAQSAKLNIRASYEMPLEWAIDYERHMQTISFGTEDADEGRRAFAERREPLFKGK